MYNKKSLGSAAVKGALGLAATCLLAGAALAGNVPSGASSALSQSGATLQKEVRFGDLDLSSVQGRTTLNERIRFAASDVCSGKNASDSLSPVLYQNCYSVAVRDAKQQLNERPALAQGSTVSAIR